MILKFIRFDLENSTIEVQWLRDVLDTQGNAIARESAACVNYSAEQKAEFLADVPNGQPYSDAMGW